MKVNYVTISKQGLRSNNEDTLRVVEMGKGGRWLGIVCDGMGGHTYGEVASETVAAALADFWLEQGGLPDSREKVARACRAARKALNRRADRLGHPGMGTTMVMASIEADWLTVAHVGDSRCYLLRRGAGLLFRTADHVCAEHGQEYVARCFFSYRAGVSVPDVFEAGLLPGDRLLLCSDGLYKCMPSGTLLQELAQDRPLAEVMAAYDSLCEACADDNYTAILAEMG